MEDKYFKFLVAGDIKDRCTVPENWMEILEKLFINGSNEALLRVVDCLGQVHDLRCATRRGGRSKKPVFQACDWKKFVNYAGLQVGDKIILQELHEAHFQGASYRIIAQRIDRDGCWANIQPPARAAPKLLKLFKMERGNKIP